MTPLPDVVAEAERLLEAARGGDFTLRVLGGVAVRLHAARSWPELEREFKDLDVLTMPRQGRRLGEFLADMGYEPDETFNTLNAGRRGLFYDMQNRRRLDVFMGDFEMCHRIPLMARLDAEMRTLPLAELLLTKLQVVELNRRDETDMLLLLLEHEVGSGDAETVNADVIAGLCARDWGLWRTVGLNVERLREALGGYSFTAAEAAVVRSRLDALWERIEAEPKSSKWKLRARIGDRVRWYEQPEETE